MAAVVLTANGCSSGSGEDEVRTFDVRSDLTVDDRPEPEPDLPPEADSLLAVVLEAPLTVAADEEFQFTVELRNQAMEPVELTPCPWFYASFGESGTSSSAQGPLPCEELSSIGSGERVRLRFSMTAPSPATAGEIGWASLEWRLGGTRATRAEIPLPMVGVTGP
jgi:hypothetical protein